ncbi:MAG: AlwI family type II restriction endonuclease [Firmicutes bacterium]|nr:AlwI family type II restriction endonuclease [Bacillota bacterium]
MPRAKIKREAKFKQMSLETAVRSPERYKDILSILIEYENAVLNDENLLEIVTHLYREGIVSALRVNFDNLTPKKQKTVVITVNSTRKADGGFPQGYASRFWTYVRTLSEFGFLYAEYNKPLLFSQISKLLVEKRIDDQIAFSTQSAIYNRKSPFRNVSNDYNYFRFITEVLMKLDEQGKSITYEQFTLSLFSKTGDANRFIEEIQSISLADADAVYEFVKINYGATNKKKTITKDYPDVVLRLLKITGFISIQYTSRVKILLNSDKADFIKQIFEKKFEFDEEQKSNSNLYFQQYNVYSSELIAITTGWSAESKEIVHNKLKRVIEDYDIDLEKIKTLLSNFEKDKDKEFKYVPNPLKLEFYLSLLLYLVYGLDHIVAPNYKVDSLGMPISHAPGNHGDIYVYSDVINWLIEVTLIRNKQQQLNSETTSVIRHLEEDTRECYLSFVAPFVHPDTMAFYDNEIIRMLLMDKIVYLKTYGLGLFIDDVLLMNNLSTMKTYTNDVVEKVKRKLAR